MDVSGVGRVGIVGATSPLGKAFTEMLLEQGHPVCAGYRDPNHVPAAWWSSSHVRCVEADVGRPNAFVAFEDCDVIVWMVHRRQGMAGAQEVALNVEPFQRCCTAMSSFACSRILFISSGGSVYGEPASLPIPEDHARHPLSPYGSAKKRMEDALWAWGAKTGKATGVLRPGNLYGPESLSGRSKGIISSYLRSLSTQTPFTLLGGGSAVRDYIHVDDVSRALLHALGAGQQQLIWNVGTGVGCSASEVVALIGKHVPRPVPPVTRQPARATDVSANILANDRIQRESGWRPQISLEDGIRSILQRADIYR